MASVSKLDPSGLRSEATALFRAAIAAVQPTELVRNALGWQGAHPFVLAASTVRLELPVTVVGAGKAAAAMAEGCEQALGPQNVVGEVIVPDGIEARLQSIAARPARHPLPDDRGVAATRSLLERVRTASVSPTLCLISGGASSLLVCPRAPLTLEDKVVTNRLLLECGAEIHEVNTVRKHLSDVKGGGLLRQAASAVVTLLISDVVGDDPGTIGSGPTCPDPTTFDDAHNIIAKYGLDRRLPASVLQLIADGCRGIVPETLKPNTADASRGRAAVIGSNLTALQGAAEEARARGWEVVLDERPLVGDTREAARRFAADLKRQAAQMQSAKRCVLIGGETTVQVRGHGRGGRNQEFALALAAELQGQSISVLSAGTDGIDGPTRAAGAFVDGQTGDHAQQRGLSIEAALAENDSCTFFDQLDDLFVCGPTGTNVMDIKIALLTA